MTLLYCAEPTWCTEVGTTIEYDTTVTCCNTDNCNFVNSTGKYVASCYTGSQTMGSRLSLCDENIVPRGCQSPYNKFCMIETTFLFGYAQNTYQCSDYCEEGIWNDLQVSCCNFDDCNRGSLKTLASLTQIAFYQILFVCFRFIQ